MRHDTWEQRAERNILAERVAQRSCVAMLGVIWVAAVLAIALLYSSAWAAPVVGTHRVALMIVSWGNLNNSVTTPAGAAPTATAITAFYDANSYGALTMQVDVLGVYKVAALAATCDYGALAAQADAKAIAAGVNLAVYQHKMYNFPGAACGTDGFSTIGGTPSSSWLPSWYTPAHIHEMGHSLGLYHSHSCSGNLVPSGGNACHKVEDGDTLDVMGKGLQGSGGHFNALQKAKLGWITPRIETTGTYTLEPYETTGDAVCVPRGTLHLFCLEYRLPQPDGHGGGVAVHLRAPTYNPDAMYLLKLSPAAYGWSDPALLPGSYWVDAESGIVLQVDSADASGATITINGPIPPPLPDADGDGVPDALDLCPGIPGPAPLGCPLTDVSTTFTLTSLALPQKLVVDVPPYRCIRTTGGASQLKIAKVAGTVETILKSVGVPNPIVNVPFTIRCQIPPPSVILSLNGVVKLTTPVVP